jgi:hypothetical protein
MADRYDHRSHPNYGLDNDGEPIDRGPEFGPTKRKRKMDDIICPVCRQISESLERLQLLSDQAKALLDKKLIDKMHHIGFLMTAEIDHFNNLIAEHNDAEEKDDA